AGTCGGLCTGLATYVVVRFHSHLARDPPAGGSRDPPPRTLPATPGEEYKYSGSGFRLATSEGETRGVRGSLLEGVGWRSMARGGTCGARCRGWRDGWSACRWYSASSHSARRSSSPGRCAT